MIYFIMGISGSGKSTLIKNLKELNNEKLFFPLSYKTRQIRENEINGVDAFFIKVEEFFSQVNAGEFLEYAIVHETDYYGTKYNDVLGEDLINKIVIKELDINGLEKLRREKPELDNKYKTIFLNIPVSVLKERIEKRGVMITNEELDRRINSAIIEEEKIIKICDYQIDATKNHLQVLNEFLDIIGLN